MSAYYKWLFGVPRSGYTYHPWIISLSFSSNVLNTGTRKKWAKICLINVDICFLHSMKNNIPAWCYVARTKKKLDGRNLPISSEYVAHLKPLHLKCRIFIEALYSVVATIRNSTNIIMSCE